MPAAPAQERESIAPAPWAGVTLTDLFASTAQLNPQAIALSQSQGPLLQRRTLTYAAADRAIQRVREHLADLGLAGGDVILVSLAATLEAPVAILAALRAGLSPCLVPVTLGRDEARALMQAVPARAIITTGAVGPLRPVEVLREAAVTGGGPRFILAFGERLPAGVVRLDEALLRSPDAGYAPPPGSGSDHPPAILTLARSGQGFEVVRHEQSGLVASALLTVLKAGIGTGEPVLSTLSPMGLAGLVTGLVPCLLTAGTLALEPVFSSSSFLASLSALGAAHVAGPGALEGPIGEAGLAGSGGLASLILVHRPPARLDRVPGTAGWSTRAVDVLALSECALLVEARGEDGRPGLRLGTARVPEDAGSLVIEARLGGAELLEVRGPAVSCRNGDRDDGATWRSSGCIVRCDDTGRIVSARV